MVNESYLSIKEKVLKELKLTKDEVFKLNDYLADNPEISGKEYNSCEEICKVLENHGIEVERKFNGQPTAFKGVVRREKSSDIKIAILTEYDALPEIGHACGHCASGSISILSALALASCEDLPPCNIDIIGTPDEEVIGGKALMAEDGVFDDYSFAIMIHMNSGKMNLVKADMLAIIPLSFKFKGQAAHAAACPWDGKNALNGATLMLHAVDMLRQHVLPSSRIHGVITQGGVAPNIVPENAVVDMFIRCPDKFYLEELIRMITDCANGAAMATQTEVEIEQCGKAFDNMLHIPTGIEILKELYKEQDICDYSDRIPDLTGSSDVGNVSFRCPTFQTMISVCDENVVIHSKEFASLMKSDGTKKSILQGAEIITGMIVKTLVEPKLIRKMKDEFNELTNRK
ncbi:M20 family metallopeptidase [Clostridium sp.]|uniref:M20 family metallopeptidase n=1 Tax=Clostridium sp. TaxID=1506 RepID=UPI0032172A7F